MHAEPITPELLCVLRRLSQMDGMSGFALGGGTSLALRFGHRKSVDIDMFSVVSFDPEGLLHEIRACCETVEIFNRTSGSLCLGIDGVKVDILHHAYQALAPVDILDGISFLSLSDLAAMKVNAVTNRGSKKDFSDLLLLHRQGFSLAASLDLFCAKYGQSGRFLALKSLAFLDDAHLEPDPVYLNGWTWRLVADEMETLVKELIQR